MASSSQLKSTKRPKGRRDSQQAKNLALRPDAGVSKKKNTDRDSKEGSKLTERDPQLTDTLFLRNVARFDTTQESLKKHMEENFGKTVYCLICKDKETGESRGTAFVKFEEPETAATCLKEFADYEKQTKFFLDGRNLFVLPALTRDQASEVKQANAKPDPNVVKKKKFKKARHHRVPNRKKEKADD